MTSIFSFVCSQCGDRHDGAPSFGFDVPAPYLEQTDVIKEAGVLSSDLCQYEDEDGIHHFIRACLEVPIQGYEEPFMWGIWSSLSKENFNRYVETYEQPETSDEYFGWLCNYLPYYPNTYAMKLSVHPRSDGNRPYVIPEKSDHQLSIDFHEGISIAAAQKIAEEVMHQKNTDLK